MFARIGIAAAVALVGFLALSSASFAASKNSQFSDNSQCLGGGCTGRNPDRTPNYYTLYYKGNSKSKKRRSHSSANN